MRDPRVLVVGLSAHPESFILRTLEAVAESGPVVSVATRRPPVVAAASRIAWIGDPQVGGSDVAARLVTRARELRRHPSRLRWRRSLSGPSVTAAFDLIYLPWINTAVERPELFDLGLPVAVSCRGSFVAVAPWNPRRAAFRNALSTVFRRASGVHCVSRSMQGDAESLGLAPEKATVVYTGVDTTLYRPDPAAIAGPADCRDELRILWVGSLNWKKDVEHALLAVAAAERAGRKFSMSIVGSGEELDRARFTRDDLGLGCQVRFVGQVGQQDLPALHRAHDVLLHSASTEGVPNVVVEAMASGLPVVATDVGGTGEAVTDAVEGFLVPVRSPERMGERLVTLADDGGLRRQMGEAGRRRAIVQFDLARHAVGFRAFLDQAARPA